MGASALPAEDSHEGEPAREPDGSGDARGAAADGGRRRGRARTHVAAGAVAAFVTGAVGLAATASGVLFDAFPSLRPDPGVELGVEMHVLRVDRGVTFSDYWNRIREKGAPPAQVARDVGDVAYVRVRIRGRKNQKVSLARSVYALPSGRRLGSHSTQQDQYFEASTTNDQWIAQVWLPPMLHSQRFFARLELWQGRDLLAFDDTPALRGSVRRL